MREIKVIFHVIKLSITRSLVFKSSSILNFMASILMALGNIFVILTAIFKKTPSILGWTKGEVIVIQGVMSIIVYLYYTLNERGLWKLSYMIEGGYLDLILLRPIDPKIFVSFSAPDLKALLRVITGVLVLFYGFSKANPLWHNLPWFFMSLTLSYFLYLEINLIFFSVSFYLYRAYMLYEIISDMEVFGQYPVRIFGKVLSFVFLTIIPLGVVSNFPARIILGKGKVWKILGYEALIVIFLYMVVNILWSAGIKRYEGVGN